MTLEELLERIKRLDVSLIENMSSDVLVRLTDRFDKSLVMYMVCKGDTTNEQRRILKVLRNAYKEWKLSENMFWGMSPHSSETYPEYFIQMKLDIECGILITEDRIPTDKGRKIKELEARIEELEKNQPEEMSEEDIDAICDTEEDNKMLLEKGSHSVKTGEEIEDPDDLEHLQARIKELEADLKSRDDRILELEEENENLKKQLAEQKNSKLDSDFPELDEVQILTLHQKIVFFTTVTSVLLNKRYTNMRNLAYFIASMCNENQKTIAPMLSRIGKISDDNPNPQLSTTLHSAAQCVSDMLFKILTDETKHDKSQTINKIRENLLLIYPLPEDE